MNQIAVDLNAIENKFTTLTFDAKGLEINRIIGNCQSESRVFLDLEETKQKFNKSQNLSPFRYFNLKSIYLHDLQKNLI